MKKLAVLLMAVLALCSCAYAETDLEYIKAKGTLVVGVTEFKPMDYKNEKGEWEGFDADLARAFADSLGVKLEFQEIEWNNKILELNSKNIDCLWNGMTLTPEVQAAMLCSNPYCNNAQVVVVPVSKAAEYSTLEAIQNLSFAVEHGSTGDVEAEKHGFKAIQLQDQASALMEVASGTADAAIIDLIMAAAMTGKGTGYEQLTHTLQLNGEVNVVGVRKGSDLGYALNAFFEAGYADGSIMKVAEKYGIQEAVITK